MAARGSYRESDYTSERKDDYITIEVDPQYIINRWLTAGVGYRYRERRSNREFAAYKNNIFLISLTMEF